MKFWTFQRKDILSSHKLTPIIPNFDSNEKRGDPNINGYRYILNEYNQRYNTTCKGLIFGICGGQGLNEITTIRELIFVMTKMGFPGGTHFPSSTHSLLELDVPDDINIMKIDFYRFSDLLYYFDSSEEEDDGARSYSIEHLFKPNNGDGSYELVQGHIPFILPEWIVNRNHEDLEKLGEYK